MTPKYSAEERVAHTPRHTKLPWKTWLEDATEHAGAILPDAANDVVLGPDRSYVAGTQADFRSPEEAEANAELICRAVNSHEALVSALRAIQDEEVLYAWVNEKNLGMDEYTRRSTVIEKLRAALQAAGGQQ